MHSMCCCCGCCCGGWLHVVGPVELQDVSVVALEAIVDFAHTGKLEISG